MLVDANLTTARKGWHGVRIKPCGRWKLEVHNTEAFTNLVKACERPRAEYDGIQSDHYVSRFSRKTRT